MAGLKRLIERYEESPMGFGLWLSTALFIIFVRDAIENIVSFQAFPIADAFHLIHVPVFFISLLLFLILILHVASGTDIRKASKIALLPFAIIIFPVLLDFVFSYFSKTRASYYYIQDNIWICLLRFFDPTYIIPELPSSIRLEIALVTLISFGYVFVKRKNIFPSLLGSLAAYLICFLYVSIPALLIEMVKLLVVVINFLHLRNFPLPEGIIDENIIVLLELFVTAFLAAIWLWRFDQKKCFAAIKNMRLARSLHYCLLFLLGVVIHCLDAKISDLFSIMRIAGSLLSLFLAFQFSVVINDIFDEDCDKVSNPGRPLVTGALKRNEYLNIAYVYLALSLLFSYWVNETSVMIVLLYLSFYFLYSAPPFRLKRFFPLSVVIIGFEAVLAFAMGEAAFTTRGMAPSFHTYFFWPVFVIFTLGANIKDLKDIEGDKRAGVATLPVLLGKKMGRDAVAILVSLSYCLAPYFLHPLSPGLKVTLLAACFAVANLLYIRRESAREEIIFLSYFVYAGLLVFLLR